jgi:hypothetical protein
MTKSAKAKGRFLAFDPGAQPVYHADILVRIRKAFLAYPLQLFACFNLVGFLAFHRLPRLNVRKGRVEVSPSFLLLHLPVLHITLPAKAQILIQRGILYA